MAFHSAVLILTLSLSSVFGANTIITSPPITDWGNWGDFENCPSGTYVKGFQLKTEPWKGPIIDDTCLNGIRLYCGNPLDGNTKVVTSSIGSWGIWGSLFSCGDGNVVGFQLRVEKFAIIDADETATNNMRIFCSNHAAGNYIVGDGERWGDYSDDRQCPANQAVCGIRTQVQPDRGILLDDSALNNVSMECCDIPSTSEAADNAVAEDNVVENNTDSPDSEN